MIKKLTLPLIHKYLKLIIGIIVAAALSFCMIFALVFSCDSVKSSYDTFVKDYHFPDAYFYTEIIDSDIVDEISKIGDIQSVNNKIVFDTNTRLDNGAYVTLRISTYDSSDSSLLYTYAIDESVEYPNIAVSKKFLDNNDVNVGDLLKIDLDDSDTTFCIGRSITTPECVNVYINKYVDTFSEDLGYAYIPEEYLIDTDFQGKTNCITVRFESWADKQAVFNEVKKLLGDKYLEGFVYEDSEAGKLLDRNIEPLKKASYILTIVFLIIVSFVSYLFLTQIIDQDKKDIAVLRILGYQIRDIRLLFSRIVLVANLISILIGVGIGFVALNIIIRIYLGIFSLPLVYYSFNWMVFLFAILLIIGSGQLAVVMALGNIKKISPKDCFSNEMQTENSKNIAVYKKLGRFDIKIKYALASVVRSKKRFVISSLCLTFVVLMVFASLAFYHSKNVLMHTSFDIKMNYDYELFFDNNQMDEFIDNCNNSPYVSSIEKMSYKIMTISNGEASSEQKLVGVVDNNKLNYYLNFKGEYITKDNEIILNHRCAKSLKTGIGDTVYIGSKPFKVVGITTEYQREKCYVSYNAIENVWDVDDYSVKVNCNDRDELARLTDSCDNISAIIDTSIQKKGAEDEYKIYNLATVMIIVFSLLIGYVIVSNTMQTTLYERKKELSVLRTIGYQVSDISKIWLITTSLQIALAVLIGLSFGSLFAQSLLDFISVPTRQYPFVADWSMYILTVAIVIVFVVATHILVVRSIKKWDVVEIIKEKD